MPFATEELPLVFNRILEEMEKNGGQMTTDEFKQYLYTVRFTKNDVKDVKRWLNLNGYIVINHGYQKEVMMLTKK